MGPPDVSAWLIAAYALVMLGAAWAVDVLGSRSARRSMGWRHSDFIYHDDVDGWRCHEDQWLWPAAFDPDKRVIRYEGAHAICGRCPSKDVCSPTPGPREITRPVDPWPYSEAGRFHRGVALVIACVGVFIPLLLSTVLHGAGDLIVLGTTAVIVVVTGVLPLARHLWSIPDNAPAHLPHIGSQERRVAQPEGAARTDEVPGRGGGPVPVVIGRRPSGYRSVREAAEAIAAARDGAASSGRAVSVSFVDGAGSAVASRVSREPELRRVAALRTRGRAPVGTASPADDAIASGTTTAAGGARRSWPSAWSKASPSRPGVPPHSEKDPQ